MQRIKFGNALIAFSLIGAGFLMFFPNFIVWKGVYSYIYWGFALIVAFVQLPSLSKIMERGIGRDIKISLYNPIILGLSLLFSYSLIFWFLPLTLHLPFSKASCLSEVEIKYVNAFERWQCNSRVEFKNSHGFPHFCTDDQKFTNLERIKICGTESFFGFYVKEISEDRRVGETHR